MCVGASTANLYPLETEVALEHLLRLGFRQIEIFLNTRSETRPEFVRALRRTADAAGAAIVAVHPYVSCVDAYLLFSGYDRRWREGLELYDEIFAAAEILGAPYVVFHGDKPGSGLTVEQSLERFRCLYDRGRQHGVSLLQENVVNFRSADPTYLQAMQDFMGEDAGFVLDIKQCRRCGLTPEFVMNIVGKSVKHAHISDADFTRDCLAPGRGTVDFDGLLSMMKRNGYDGTFMLELYRTGFLQEENLAEGANILRKILNNLGKID